MVTETPETNADRGVIANILRNPLTSLVTGMGHLGSWGFVAVAILIVFEVIMRPLG